MDEDPAQYVKIDSDVYLLDAMGNGEDDIVLLPTDKVITDPLSGEAIGKYDEVDAARATPAERAQWAQDAAVFLLAAAAANTRLDEAKAAWEDAQKTAALALRKAWENYQPTQELIQRRIDQTRDLRDEQGSNEARALADAADAAQAAEDAELGARTWAVYQRQDTYGPKKPDMLVPVLHLAGCPVLKGSENNDLSRSARRLRAGEAREVLFAGGRHWRRESDERFPTKLCGRCKPADSLRAALGEDFDTWMHQTKAIQPPLPARTEARADQLRKVIPAFRPPYRRTSGYVLMSDRQYRQKQQIETYEALVGWYEQETDAIMARPERLQALIDGLPEQGWAVRRVQTEHGEEPYAVAVRKMTAAEIEQRDADKAATADVEAPATVNLEDR